MSTNITITRVDMFSTPTGIFVCKYADGWKIGTPPCKRYTIEDKSLDELVSMFSDPWQVRRWSGGARAWRGDLKPIRSRNQILQKRESLTRYPIPGVELHTLNLALDF